MAKRPSKEAAPRSATPRKGGGVRERVAVIGPGQMGLVCAGLLTSPEPGPDGSRNVMRDKGLEVAMWGRDKDELTTLAQSRRSPRLPGYFLPREVLVCMDPAQALQGATLIVSAVPVQHTRQAWTRIAKFVPAGVGVVSVAKGIEVKTLLRPTQIIADVLAKTGRDDPDGKPRPLAALSGPTIAAELARCLPATLIAASDDPQFATRVQHLFTTSWMRVYTNSDVLGVELAGAAKNIIAIAAGVIDGLKAGNNAKSALLARGLAEIVRLGTAMGASPDTFFGIAGAGDLATSCFSPEGRNRTCGEALGKGEKLEDYLKRTGATVEGVWTTKAVSKLATKYKVEMPITDTVRMALFEGLDPIAGISALMTREKKAEKVR